MVVVGVAAPPPRGLLRAGRHQLADDLELRVVLRLESDALVLRQVLQVLEPQLEEQDLPEPRTLAPGPDMALSPEQLVENAQAFVDSVVRAKPASAKGNYIQNVTLAATMLPGVPLEQGVYTKSAS